MRSRSQRSRTTRRRKACFAPRRTRVRASMRPRATQRELVTLSLLLKPEG
jgi:hypothetical protein